MSIKKVLVLILSMSMVLALMAGCNTANTPADTDESSGNETVAGETTADETDTEETGIDETKPITAEDLVGGIFTMSISTPIFDAMNNVQKTTIEAADGTVVEAAWDLTADGTVSAIEELIQKGANAISFCPFDEAILPKISRICEEAKCYFSLTSRYIADDDIRAELEVNPYFAGTCKEDEEQAGYDIIAQLAQEKGVKQIALIGQPTGDQVTDGRDAGIQRACEEFGVDLVAEIRNIGAASDATKAVESFFASYPDLNAVIFEGTNVPGCVAAILTGFENAGMTGKAYLAGWDFDDTMQAGFDSGTIFCFAGGHLTTDPVIAYAIAINAAKGTPLSADGPVYLNLPMMMVYSWNDVEDYLNNVIYNDNVPYTSEELQQNLFKFENSSITAESVQSYIGNWSLEDVMTRHGG